jgi:hypothetical protein
MPKPQTTKTLGPLHFEDLEPHRFEDLIRQLVYDFKEWQSIEATGRSGADEGWDIRAFEKQHPTDLESEDDEEASAPPSLLSGNAWMIQVKREKTLGPSDVKRIVSEVDSSTPPYGYILAAPTNFSKRSYDVFRAELQNKGVREFYVWGRAALEDMLQLPKNDRILFTFFGISLTSRRRSRTTEVRAAFLIKNKLYRVLGEHAELHADVLLRDLADTHYPYRREYADWGRRRRWRKLTAVGHHPRGLWLRVHKYYAYVDRAAKEWDFTRAIDLCDLSYDSQDRDDEEMGVLQKTQRLVLDSWELLPKARQAILLIDRLLPYAGIAAIDDKGDGLYKCPHVFVDFGERGPFVGEWPTLKVGEDVMQIAEDFKRIKRFRGSFTPVVVKMRREALEVDAHTREAFAQFQEVGVLFALDDRYRHLQALDVVRLSGVEMQLGRDPLVEITYVGQVSVAQYLAEAQQPWKYRQAMQAQLGSEISDDLLITYLEYKRYHHALDEEGSPEN